MVSPNTSEILVGYEADIPARPPRSLKLRFAKDVFVFGWANVICLVLNGTLTFLLPRYLAIEDFGYYRLFVLYASLAGTVHLGFLDGILIRWAEKPDERVGPEINNVLAFLIVQHCAILLPPCLALTFWFRTPRLVWLVLGLAAYVLIFNCSFIGQIALQTRKQFNQLSLFAVVTAASLLLFIFGWKLLGHLNAGTAIASTVAANLVAGVGIWKAALTPRAAPAGAFHNVRRFGLENIHLGWKILLANLLLTVTPNLDRFFVSGAFSIQDFAIYAFAGNALAVVYTVAISAARVVYPYLSEGTSVESRRRAYKLGQATVLSLWALSLILYFPTAFLVRWIVPNYVASLPVVRLLMINSGFVCMIHILHGNYFRVNLALNRFLTGSLVGLIAAAILLALARHTANLQWIAAAMTAAIVLWWTTNEVLLAPRLGGSWADRGRIFVLWFFSSAAFLGTCAIRSLWLGGTVYALACILLLVCGLRKTIPPLFTSALAVASAGSHRQSVATK